MVGEREHLPITIFAKITGVDGKLEKLVEITGMKFTVDDVIHKILKENYDFIIEKHGIKTQIIVKEENGKAYLSTIGDIEKENNIDSLPEF